MTEELAERYDAEMRSLVAELIRFETVTDRPGAEEAAQAWLVERLEDLGFETYEWEPDPAALAAHPTFPDDPEETVTEGRPSVAGVLEFGDPDAGRTLLYNAHMDVAPVEPELWTGDPFEPRWVRGAEIDGVGPADRETEFLLGRGSADLKGPLTAAAFAARHLADVEAGAAEGDDGLEGPGGLDGRIVVESVAGEEDGGIGAAAAALSNPYPFERDAAVVVEPTELRLVTATEGTLFLRLGIDGRSAHAGTRWEGESVLPHFERIRAAFRALEAERAERVVNPLYADLEIPWPVNVGIVEAGSWPSSVPAELTAKLRIGVAPDESHAAVEREFRERLEAVASEDEWLSAHPPTLERFAANFPSAETAPGEPIVRAVQGVLEARGLDPARKGVPYGADAARYVAMAGIPSVLLGPGSIEQAHGPDEYVRWPAVLDAAESYADVARAFLGDGAG